MDEATTEDVSLLGYVDRSLTFVYQLIKELQPGVRNKFNLSEYLATLLKHFRKDDERDLSDSPGGSKGRKTLQMGRGSILFRKGLHKMRHQVRGAADTSTLTTSALQIDPQKLPYEDYLDTLLTGEIAKTITNISSIVETTKQSIKTVNMKSEA